MNLPALMEEQKHGLQIDYATEIEAEIRNVIAEINRVPELLTRFQGRWLAIKLLEKDPSVSALMCQSENASAVLDTAEQGIARLEKVFDEETDVLFAEERYNWINAVVRTAVIRPPADQQNLSDLVDKILTDRSLGLPIFFFTMWVVFKLTADVSASFMDWLNNLVIEVFSRWAVSIFTSLGLGGSWVASLFVDGILTGVGAVLVFIPVLISLYLALALLEESGYMARAAFVMDHFMRLIGLHGKSFLPLMVGFGCSVPAIYATRTLENERHRILTGLLVPFMSCGARLPVYVLFAAIFFPDSSGLVIFSMYALGIVIAILMGRVFNRTIFKESEPVEMILELPSYRMPSLKHVWRYTWERTRAFIESAWSLILTASVVIWLLLAIPAGDGQFASVNVADSAFAWVSRQVSRVLEPLGFGDWETGGALISGLVAKEVVVATMAQVYVEEEGGYVQQPVSFQDDLVEIGTGFLNATRDSFKSFLQIFGIDLSKPQEEIESSRLMAVIRSRFEASSKGHGSLAGFAFMVFVLLYTPCMAAVAAEKQELGIKWMWLSVLGQLLLAWFAALVIFQTGVILGIG